MSLTLIKRVGHGYWEIISCGLSLKGFDSRCSLLRLNNLSNEIFLPFWASINDLTRTPSLASTLPFLRPCLPPAPNLWLLLLIFQIAWFHYDYERCNDDDRGNCLANVSFDYVHYSWKELKNEGLQSPLEESRKRPGLGRRTTFKQIFCSSRKDSTYVLEMLDCIVCSSFDVCVIHPDVSLPPYRIPHQCHQCSNVNRRCHNRPIRGYTGIQYTGTTFC